MTKKPIKVVSDELALSLHEGQVKANIKELPYGEQSLIMHEDFNFDGVKDFAIEDGQNSCYHGPSFKIYLAVKNGFIYNKDFTRLAQEYCGMFEVDRVEKKIKTMTKSGCCWHQFSEFIIENNKPKTIKIIEEDGANFPYSTFTEQIWDGKKMVKSSIRTINLEQEGLKIILSFKVEQNGKEVVLFNLNDRILNYALIQKDGKVEFSYPLETVYQNPDFTFNSAKNQNTLIFSNKNTKYRIYETTDTINSKKLGIEVTTNNKVYDFAGVQNSKKGTLTELLKTKLDNVVIPAYNKEFK